MRIFFTILLSLLIIPFSQAYAHDRAEMTDALWSPDETQFLFGEEGSSAGCYEMEWFKLFEVSSHRVLKEMKGENCEDDETGKRLMAQVRKARKGFRNKGFTGGGWLAPDPMTYSDIPWPGWPPGGKHSHTVRITINGAHVDVTLRVVKSARNSNPNEDEFDLRYELFVRTASETKDRQILSWGPKPTEPNEAQDFTLGGITISPSGKWLCILLRQFDRGYEGPHVTYKPLFVTVESVKKS